MEPLAKLLQQAQTVVLGVQEDVATMRAQLDEHGDEAIVDPCVVDLQMTIQQKQEAAADLLKQGATLFYEAMGDLDERARALGNIHAREKELEKTKKAMHRYFEAQKKTQDELRAEYDGLLSGEANKLAHLTDGAADLIQANADRRLQHRALMLWLKKAMVRSFWRLHQRQEEQTEIQHVSLVQEHDSVAQDAFAQKRTQLRKQKLFHKWQCRTYANRNARLKREVEQLEKEAEYFRSEGAKTQRLLNGHLQDVHAKMQLVTSTKSKECELLDDEVGRLKTAIAELTGEFSERTQTYVRQQEETELFFQRTEKKLREALAETQLELERLRAQSLAFEAGTKVLQEGTTSHMASMQHLFDAWATKKAEVFGETATAVFGRLAQRHRRTMEEAAELHANVELLAPLSEKVLRVENDLAAATAAANTHRKAALVAQRRATALGDVSSLLTDNLERANHHKLRSLYFMRWSTHAVTHKKRAVAAELAGLQKTHTNKQREFLIQQQSTAANHREERDRLVSELEDERVAVKKLQKDLLELHDTLERKEGENLESQMSINTLKAQLTRSRDETRAALAKLAESRVSNLKLEEDNRRYSLEYKEVKWRWALHQETVGAWRADAVRHKAEVEQLTRVCGEWQTHCDTTESARRARSRAVQQHAAVILDDLRTRSSLLPLFESWRSWAHHTRAAKATTAAAEDKLAAMEQKHAEELLSQRKGAGERVAALQMQHEEKLTEMASVHALERTRQESLHEKELVQVKQKHLEKVSTLLSGHQKQQDALSGELAEAKGRLNEVGDLVVYYCAQAAFGAWSAFAKERRARRAQVELARQSTKYQCAAQRWMTSRAELITERYQRGDEILLAVTAHNFDVQVKGQTQQYADLHHRHEKLTALFGEVTEAGEALEQQLGSTKSQLRKLVVELDTERDHAAAVQGRLERIAKNHGAQRLLYERVMRHQQRLTNVSEEHLRCVLLAFEEASDCIVRKMCEERSAAAAAVQAAAQRREETEEAARELDVSDISSEEEPIHSTSISVENGGQQRIAAASAPANTEAPHASLLIPGEVASRLQALEEASALYVQSQERDNTTLESIASNLATPFVGKEAEGDFCESAAHLQPRTAARLPPRHQCTASVAAALEVVRKSALHVVASKQRAQETAEAGAQRRIRDLNEVLQDARYSMSAMLDEQRRVTEEMRAHLSLSRSHSRSSALSPGSSALPPQQHTPLTENEHEVAGHAGQLSPAAFAHMETQTSAFLMDAWTEKLDSITTRYQRVLDAFYSNLEDRRDTFYSVNGMLLAAEMFSEELLARFTADLDEMQKIRESRLGELQWQRQQFQSEPPQSRHVRSIGTSPADERVSRCTQSEQETEWEQQTTSSQMQNAMVRVLGEYERVLHEMFMSVQREQDAFRASAALFHEADSFSAKLVERLKSNLNDAVTVKELAAKSTGPLTDNVEQRRLHEAERSLSQDFGAASDPASPEALATDQHTSTSSTRPMVSLLSPVSRKEDSPEKVLLRDRVELLEKLLVQSKVQLAETRQLLSSGSGGFSLPSLQEPTVGGDEPAGAATAAAAALFTFRKKEQDMKKDHEEQLMRVRADTEQLVAMRYKEDLQQREAKIRSLVEQMEDNTRHAESEKDALLRQLASLNGEMEEATGAHERAVEQLRRSFQRDLDELTHENALLQRELDEREQRTSEAVAQALSRQKELLELEAEAKTRQLSREVQQLTQEKEYLAKRKAASEAELQRVAAEERNALRRAEERHEEELRVMTERYKALLSNETDDGARGQSPAEAETQAALLSSRQQTCLSLLHHHYDTAVQVKFAYVMDSLEDVMSPPLLPPTTGTAVADMAPSEDLSHLLAATGDSALDLMAAKSEWLLESGLAAVEEAFVGLLEQAMQRMECEKEELETENMQLHEQVARMKSAAVQEPSADRSEHGDVNDLSGGEKTGPSPPLHQSSPYASPSPAAERDTSTPMVVPSKGLPPRTRSGSPQHEHRAQSVDATSPSVAAGTPDGQAMSDPYVTPRRPSSRSRSVDSLELSQQMLRYSRMLHEQEERNAERLSTADVLTAQVDDLIARGERLRAFAEQENITPQRRRSTRR